MKKKTIIILCGIPCSGKSTWAKNKEFKGLLPGFPYTFVISRDKIREKIYGKYYKQNSESEKGITQEFNTILHYNLTFSGYSHIILDNTHCKEYYINDIINKYENKYHVYIKFFDIPLWKAHWRKLIK